jgi:hypothetical protein
MSSFDWKFYTSYYPDLARYHTEIEAYSHYMRHGQKEGRICNREQLSADLVLICNIGNREIFLDMVPTLQQIIQKCKSIYVYLTLLSSMCSCNCSIPNRCTCKENLFALLSLPSEKGKLIFVENRGFDIGPFLHCLDDIKQSQRTFKYCVKIHTKSDRTWRNRLISSFEEIDRYIDKLEHDPTLGMVCSDADKRRLLQCLGNNKYHLDRLKDKFAINIEWDDSIHFCAGTIFLCRMNIFEKILESEIGGLISELNTEETVDENWYLLANPDLDISREDSIKHWKEFGRSENRSGNLIHRRLHPESISKMLRDYMIEHAYERIFGVLCAVKGFQIRGFEETKNTR